jgi:hypothetical protein
VTGEAGLPEAAGGPPEAVSGPRGQPEPESPPPVPGEASERLARGVGLFHLLKTPAPAFGTVATACGVPWRGEFWERTLADRFPRETEARPAAEVPAGLRCGRRGCLERWAAVPEP